MPLTDIDSLRQWLKSRPWLDVQQTGTEVLEQLTALSRTPMAPDQRAGLVALYHPYLEELTESLERNLLDTALPLSTHQLTSANLLLNLCQQMISNFSQILFSPEPPKAESSGLTTEGRLKQLEWMIDWLARLSLHQAQIYHPAGVDYWKTVYQAYEFLQHTGTPQKTHPEIHSRIQGKLARLLLFSIVTPQKYRPTELKQIDLFLQDLSHLVKFSFHSVDGTEKALFFFDTQKPTPPTPIKLLSQVSSPASSLTFIYPQRLIKALLKFATSSEKPVKAVLPLHQGKKLAIRLARLLSAPKRRKWKRFVEDRNCRLAVGIEPVISVLISQNKLSEDLLEILRTEKRERKTESIFRESFEIMPLECETLEPPNDNRLSETSVFWELEGSKRNLTAKDIWPEKNPGGYNGPKKGSFPIRLTNSSAQGYCIVWLDHTPNILRVGEIIGILHTQGEIELGTVRWMKHDAKPSISLGVELLSFAVTGILVYPHLNEKTTWQKSELGLLLPPQPALKKPESLLLTSHSWKTGQWVRVYYNKTNYDVYNLPQRIDATPAYDLFSLEKIS